jgi:hypothetical protein
MSIRVMTNVWQNEDVSQHRELIVLLALADFCDDDGVCFPSVPKIAKKSRMSERNAQRIIHLLCGKKWLEVLTEGGCRNGKNISNRYKILLGTEADPARGDNLSPGDKMPPRGDRATSPGGDKAMTPQGVTEPCHPNHQKEPSKETSTTTESAAVTDTAPAYEGSSSFLCDGNRSESPTEHRTSQEAAFKKEKAAKHQTATDAVSADEEDNHTQELSELLEQFRPNRKQEADLKVYVTRFGLEHATDLGDYADGNRALFWGAVNEGLDTGKPWEVPASKSRILRAREEQRMAEQEAKAVKEAAEQAAARAWLDRVNQMWRDASEDQRKRWVAASSYHKKSTVPIDGTMPTTWQMSSIGLVMLPVEPAQHAGRLEAAA